MQDHSGVVEQCLPVWVRAPPAKNMTTLSLAIAPRCPTINLIFAIFGTLPLSSISSTQGRTGKFCEKVIAMADLVVAGFTGSSLVVVSLEIFP